MGAAAQLKNLYNQILNGTAPAGAASSSGDISQMVKYLVAQAAAVELPMPALVGTENWHCLGTQLAASSTAAPTSATWPAANRALFIPLLITKGITVVKLWVLNGPTVSGNIDMAIYNSTYVRQVSIGATAQAGVNQIQEFDIADTALSAGIYYIGIALNNTTGATYRYTSAGVTGAIQTWGMAEQAAAFALPNPMVPADITDFYIPICGIATRTQVA